MSFWLTPLRKLPELELEPELRELADIEAAARSALDHAWFRRLTTQEHARLCDKWVEANDRLADAIMAREKAQRPHPADRT